MDEIKEQKGLPIRYALKFIEENNLTDLKITIEEMDQKLSGRKSRIARKRIIINEFIRLNILDTFIEKYWQNGKTEFGAKYIQRASSSKDTIISNNDEYYDNSKFAYEDDLRDYLVKNLNIIENGLKLYVDENNEKGVEYSVDNNDKRIDILALDSNEIPVVIELKVSKGYERVIGQSLYYKNRIMEIFGVNKVRIIIIAREITKQLLTATRGLMDVELYEYSLDIKLNKIINK